MDESRKQFEAEIEHSYGEDFLVVNDDGDYANWITADLWEFWVKSRAAIENELLADKRRMDWLVSKAVNVRDPMVYGSHSMFWSQAITDEEDDYYETKLREQIDEAMDAEAIRAAGIKVKE